MRRLSAFLSVFLAAPLPGQQGVARPGAFTEGFERAYTAFQAKQFASAAAELEKLQIRKPESFDVHELLGLTYAAENRNDAATMQLRKAARLSPKSASARNNLATSLVKTGNLAEAETEWRAGLAIEPDDFSANRNLARLFLQQGNVAAAVPLLEAAHRIRPDDAGNSYDLASASMAIGNLVQARPLTEELLRQKDTGELHTLLGQIDEKQARYVEAVNEFAAAARLDPSEENLFAWASELMAHRAYVPAIQVFAEGTRRYPASPRLWVGQGMALYSRGEYEPSIRALLKATDLDPTDPRAYQFLSKAYLSSPAQAEEVIEHFRRYAALKPENATAQYDYAISLWKARRVNAVDVDYPAVERLLKRAIALDGNSAEAHLQLGILYSDQRENDPAQAEFERAVQLDPSLADAHFRLGRAYLKTGENDKAQAQLDQFKTLQAQHQAAVDKERAEVQQFVVGSQTTGTPGPTQTGAPER